MVIDNKNQDKYGVFELNLQINTIKNIIKLLKMIRHEQCKEIFSFLTNKYVGLENKVRLYSLRVCAKI